MEELDLTTKDGVCALLNTCETLEDWDIHITAIKEANGGGYPDFWYDLVIIGGMCDSIITRWPSEGTVVYEGLYTEAVPGRDRSS